MVFGHQISWIMITSFCLQKCAVHGAYMTCILVYICSSQGWLCSSWFHQWSASQTQLTETITWKCRIFKLTEKTLPQHQWEFPLAIMISDLSLDKLSNSRHSLLERTRSIFLWKLGLLHLRCMLNWQKSNQGQSQNSVEEVWLDFPTEFLTKKLHFCLEILWMVWFVPGLL